MRSGASELLARADVARKLILDEPGIDRLLLLAAVVWPELDAATDEPQLRSRPERRVPELVEH
jgi:hypothetical protein